MDKIARNGLLYDFYGPLLTEHQRQIYEDAVLNDMSLSEVGDLYGISRQGVHDLLKRCDKGLEEYENKLHLIEKFIKVRREVSNINALLRDAQKSGMLSEEARQSISQIEALSGSILGEL
ncbi:MAG: YlxM family DNA-binding protein [Lachnospiraceae bacterium]|nr:YlxM family DNA-binding protein [Candidatus Merdinaster equi]